MAAIHESFKGYQPYEFTTLKSLQDPVDKLCRQSKKKPKAKETPPEIKDNDQLISLDEQQQNETESVSSADLDKGSTPTFDGTLDDLLDMKAEEKFIFEECATSKDPLADPIEADSLEKDEMRLLNEILSASSLDSSDLGKEWTAMFGEPLYNAQPLSPAPPEPEQKAEPSSGFLPSQLLEQEFGGFQASLQGWSAHTGALLPPPPSSSLSSPSPSCFPPPPSHLNQNMNRIPVKDASKSTKDLSTWYNLFADLDPLSNPDAVGKTDKEHELLNA